MSTAAAEGEHEIESKSGDSQRLEGYTMSDSGRADNDASCLTFNVRAAVVTDDAFPHCYAAFTPAMSQVQERAKRTCWLPKKNRNVNRTKK